MRYSLFIVLLILLSCSDNQKEVVIDEPIKELRNEPMPGISLRAHVDSMLALSDLIPISSVDTNILIDLRYADDNNFMHTQLYDTLQTVYLQKEVAHRLALVQKYLDSIRPGYRLLVYDGVRPLNVQQEMWDAMDTIPVTLRGKFVSNPALGSVHNFGAAVDLTIVDATSTPLDMGAGYDDFRDIAFPSKEKIFLDSGLLTSIQYRNRLLLRHVMRSQRFYNIPSEWWHFNACSRYVAEQKYTLLLSESGEVEKSDRVKKYVRYRDSIKVDSSNLIQE